MKFTEGQLRRNTLFALALDGNFQNYLEPFYEDVRTGKFPLPLVVRNDQGFNARVTKADEALVIQSENWKVSVRREENPVGTIGYEITLREEDEIYSSFKYMTKAHWELPAAVKPLDQFLDELLNGLSPDQIDRLNERLTGRPAHSFPLPQTPSPSVETPPSPSPQTGNETFTLGSPEEVHRVDFPALSTGGNLRGFELLALTLDSFYNLSANFHRIMQRERQFRHQFQEAVAKYLKDLRVVEKLRSLHDSEPNDGSEWLGLRKRSYLYAISIKDLEQNRLNVHLKDLKYRKSYSFYFDEASNILLLPEKETREAYIALILFLEDIGEIKAL